MAEKTALDRFADEIESVFNGFGINRRRPGVWAPDVELSQRDHELVVRADLPGMKREDVHVDVTDHDITISGERRQEQREEREGFYRTERSYGTFCRTIALPEGALADQATATFKDGVLEVKLPAPPEQVTRGRRLEIKDSSEPRAKS